jgi:hypothetical protein
MRLIMRVTGSQLVRGVAQGVVVGLILQSCAFAQSPVGAVGPATQLPDSPSAVQATSNHLQKKVWEQAALTQPQPEQTPPTESDPKPGAATDTEQVPVDSPKGQIETVPNEGPPSKEDTSGSTLPATQTQHRAFGTAAAESIPVTGVAASRPAGFAVAPAKQRRVRSILIKVGALVGVGVAVGTTMALSQGSPSRAPGSH